MEIPQRIELLEEAGSLIAQAIDNIEQALDGTDEAAYARAYIIPHLNTWIGNGNRYDKDVYKYIDSLLQKNEDGFND